LNDVASSARPEQKKMVCVLNNNLKTHHTPWEQGTFCYTQYTQGKQQQAQMNNNKATIKLLPDSGTHTEHLSFDHCVSSCTASPKLNVNDDNNKRFDPNSRPTTTADAIDDAPELLASGTSSKSSGSP
jgi:hypothetical protein